MSVALPTVFREQVNTPLQTHAASAGPMQSNINGILSHLQPIMSQKLRSQSPMNQLEGLPELALKRSYSARDTSLQESLAKRPCLEDPSAPVTSNVGAPSMAQLESQNSPSEQKPEQQHQQQPESAKRAISRSHSHNEMNLSENVLKITLPSLNDALAGIEAKSAQPPTVSQDYFDTYKPHDENWRFGLLDSIRKSKTSENGASLQKQQITTSGLTSATSSYTHNAATSKPKLPSIQELNSRERPLFDSRIGHKGLPSFPVRKVNFPYESNYTYLNQTYMKDVERYPEYLELAQSLVLLSRPPQPQTSPLVYAYNSRNNRTNPGLRIQTQTPLAAYQQHHHHQHPQLSQYAYAQEAQMNGAKTMVQHGLPTPQLATFNPAAHQVAYSNGIGYIPLPKSAPLPSLSHIAYGTPDNSFDIKTLTPTCDQDKMSSALANGNAPNARTRFIPITPPSVKNKTRLELMKSPSRATPSFPRMCISCGLDLSPCWRPSWSPKEGQLCNSCGLRYKKTAARCLNPLCRKIPAKGEWSSMVSKGMALYDGVEAYSCLGCGYKVEAK